MKYKKQNEKINKIKKIKYIISIILSGTALAVVPGYNGIKLYDFRNVDKTLLAKNFMGVPYTITQPKEKINVLIKDNFTVAEQEEIKTAINELDLNAKGLMFNYENVTEIGSKKITIEKNNSYVDLVTGDDADTIGYTSYNLQPLTAKILYPISININPNYLNYYDINLESIIKHELLHTLGFKDIYDEKMAGKTIMMWTTDLASKDYSQEDINTLNELYPE